MRGGKLLKVHGSMENDKPPLLINILIKDQTK